MTNVIGSAPAERDNETDQQPVTVTAFAGESSGIGGSCRNSSGFFARLGG